MGFLVNWKKSNLHLTQKLVFLGAFIDLEKGMIFPTLERYQALRDLIYLIQTSEKIQVRTFLRLLGIMNSCIDLVPWARLHEAHSNASPVLLESNGEEYLLRNTSNRSCKVTPRLVENQKQLFQRVTFLKKKPVSQTLVTVLP